MRLMALRGSWVVLALLLAPLAAQTNRQLQYELQGVEVVERIGEKIPLELAFTDDDGRNVTLAQYFKPGRPVLITLNYADCPRLCSLQLTELSKALKPMEWTPGNEFVMLTVSINPQENYERAKLAKVRYLGAVGKPEADHGWHFLVNADESMVLKLAESLGYSYKFDAETGEYRHKAAAFIVTGEGVISHYLRNLNYDATDIQARLVESGAGILGKTSEDDTGFGLNCFTFEFTDNMGRAFWYMRIGGIGIVLFVVSFVGYWWVFEFKKSRRLKLKAEAT
jgi:protein SCO1/2